jgi:hypothetical protein
MLYIGIATGLLKVYNVDRSSFMVISIPILTQDEQRKTRQEQTASTNS